LLLTVAKRIKLPKRFYRRADVVEVARDLLGKALCTCVEGRITRALITETEAYAGVTDKASHAYGGRRTRRTEPMFAEGGVAYVYLCYGIHHLFNVVTGGKGTPHAVLIRAGEPLDGTAVMLARRSRDRLDRKLMSGPGSLSRALGITTALTGTHLRGNTIWLEDHGLAIAPGEIEAAPRVGVDYAGEDAALHYRFRATLPSPSRRSGV
jgi:DNA-3-methyladenine glycosylase